MTNNPAKYSGSRASAWRSSSGCRCRSRPTREHRLPAHQAGEAGAHARHRGRGSRGQLNRAGTETPSHRAARRAARIGSAERRAVPRGDVRRPGRDARRSAARDATAGVREDARPHDAGHWDRCGFGTWILRRPRQPRAGRLGGTARDADAAARVASSWLCTIAAARWRQGLGHGSRSGAAIDIPATRCGLDELRVLHAGGQRRRRNGRWNACGFVDAGTVEHTGLPHVLTRLRLDRRRGPTVGEYAASADAIDGTGMRVGDRRVAAGSTRTSPASLLDGRAAHASTGHSVADDDVTVRLGRRVPSSCHWSPSTWPARGGATAWCASARSIRGDTPHFEYVAGEAARGTAGGSALPTGVPIVFGVLTTDTLQQALDRIGGSEGHKGEEAASTALEMIELLRRLAQTGRRRPPPAD